MLINGSRTESEEWNSLTSSRMLSLSLSFHPRDMSTLQAFSQDQGSVGVSIDTNMKFCMYPLLKSCTLFDLLVSAPKN